MVGIPRFRRRCEGPGDSLALGGLGKAPGIHEFRVSLASIDPSGGHKEKIRESVEIGQGPGVAGLILDGSNQAPLGPATDGPAQMKVGGRGSSGGKDKGGELGKGLRHEVDPFLQVLNVSLIKAIANPVGLKFQSPWFLWLGDVGSHVKETAHNVEEPVREVPKVYFWWEVGMDYPHYRAELIDGPEGLQNGIVLGSALPREELGRPSVPLAGVGDVLTGSPVLSVVVGPVRGGWRVGGWKW